MSPLRLIALVSCVVLSGCIKKVSDPPPPLVAQEAATCSVPDVWPELEKALCTAETFDIINQIGKFPLSNEEARQQVALLERLWKKDGSLGTALPWLQLNRDEVRSYIAWNLAQAIRMRRSGIPLAPLQEYALTLARNPASINPAFDAELLGMTDAPGQLPRLQELMKSPTESLRRSAISAISLRCAAADREYFASLADSATLSEADREFARALAKHIAQTGTHWCAHAAATTAGPAAR